MIPNAWKLGSDVGASNDDNVWAYCRGLNGEDLSDPGKCPVWFIKNDTFDQINDGVPFLTEGVCPWDNTTGSPLSGFDGIFCKQHSDCLPYEYCMDCDLCEQSVSAQGAGVKKVACAYCFAERSWSRKDKGMCVDQIYRSDIIVRQSDNTLQGEAKVINLCQTLEDGIDGTCPDQAICAASCETEKQKKFGDGRCDAECWGCLDWQADTYFDGGDCETDSWTKHISAGQTWTGTLTCNWPDDTSLSRQRVEEDMPVVMIIYDTKGNWVRGSFKTEWAPAEGDQEEWAITSGSQLPNEEVTILFALGSKVSLIDGMVDYDDLGHLIYTGTHIEMDDDEARDVKCTAFALTLLEGPSGDLPKEWTVCMSLMNEQACRGEGCTYNDKIPITDNVCWWLPQHSSDLYDTTKCTYGNLYANGTGLLYKNIKGRGEEGSCECQQHCKAIYDTNGPFLAYTYYENLEKEKFLCFCLTDINSITQVSGDAKTAYSGDVVEGFWRVMDNDRR